MVKFKEKGPKARLLPEQFVGEMESISNTCQLLSALLSYQGLGKTQIYQLVNDFIRIVDASCFINLAAMNHALEAMGWQKQVLNETVFGLIKEIVYSVFEFDMEVMTVN